MLKTLAIETSCDDTSIGIIHFDKNIFEVEKLLAYSQIQNHQKYGGVVPEIASRLHSEKIVEILQNIGRDEIKKVDFISVTTHPGLPGALVVGKAAAATLGSFFGKPVIQVNHIYGHICSLFLERDISEIKFPLVVLTASGGHNDIYLIEKISDNYKLEIKKLGQTLDDAAGECFDKVARMLGGPYPGGVRISEKALQGKPNDLVKFKRIFLAKQEYNFSFSGMKSQVGFLIEEFNKKEIKIDEQLICDIAYEFQEAMVEALAKKLLQAGLEYNAQTIGISGGVSANDRLREYLNELKDKKLKNAQILRPNKKIYSTDNAAMIGVEGVLKYINQ